MPSPRVLNELDPRARHCDVKLLRNALSGRKATKSLEQPAHGFLSPVARQIDNRQADMFGVRER